MLSTLPAPYGWPAKLWWLLDDWQEHGQLPRLRGHQQNQASRRIQTQRAGIIMINARHILSLASALLVAPHLAGPNQLAWLIALAGAISALLGHAALAKSTHFDAHKHWLLYFCGYGSLITSFLVIEQLDWPYLHLCVLIGLHLPPHKQHIRWAAGCGSLLHWTT